MTTTMPERMLRLLSLLQGRREWSGTELAERLGVTGRTIRRDVERLRALGYPVDGTTGTAGGYRLASGRDLPPLLLDDDEAVAVAVGLLSAAGTSLTGIEESSVRALAKLQQVLPTRLRSQVAAVTDTVMPIVHRDGPQIDPTMLAVLAASCRDKEVLAFEYENRDGTTTSRRVEPHGLVTIHRRWYLVAYDPARTGWRTFRVDRMVDPRPTRHRFAPRELPAADAAAYVASTIAQAPYRYTATLLVRCSAQDFARRMTAPMTGTTEAAGEDACRVHLRADSLDLVAQQVAAIAALGLDLTLDAHEEVRARLRAVGRRLAVS
ncbi:putative DNA-binding transcriptional regulator YafY [Kutzneria viridogrisea]|uniref:DNA-binding transcriptional regulator YafY n=2 Tax=Kutzneria viridogrisea TaxID=47990 RepID=A0ABR6BR66_9PSEU|nr:putative DNA-binding transcriptional regulator YafY [Kutzneria viridogrisea]